MAKQSPFSRPLREDDLPMAPENPSDLAKRLRQLVEQRAGEKAILFVDLLNNQWEQIPF